MNLRSLPWGCKWHTLYAVDSGGPVSTAAAEVTLDRFLERQADVMYMAYYTAAQMAWLDPLLADRNMVKSSAIGYGDTFFADPDLVPFADRIWFPDAKNGAGAWVYKEALHTGYASYLEGDGSGRNWKTMCCPNLVTGTYDLRQALLDYITGFMQRTGARIVLVDVEIWERPERVVAAYPGIVSGCSRCQSDAGYLAGWTALAHDIEQTVKAVVPEARVYFYRSWDYSGVDYESVVKVDAQHPERWNLHSYWPGGVGAGPCPAFYSCVQSEGADPTVILRQHLQIVDVHGGLPLFWGNPDSQYAPPSGRIFTPAEVRDVADLIGQGGADGAWLMWSPQPAWQSGAWT